MKIGILGATGYTGHELIRILRGHSEAEIVYLGSSGSAGQKIADIYPGLNEIVDNNLESDQEVPEEIEVLFCALPHGITAGRAEKYLDRQIKVIDLGADFRLKDKNIYEAWYKTSHASPHLLAEAVYGIPELNRAEIAGKRLIANPGCYPTATQLALVPLLKDKLLKSDSIIVDAKSGVSGAGRGTNLGVHFSEVNENFKAYGVATHRHTPEIEQELSKAAGEDILINFTPHLVPMTRGILTTIYASAAEGVEEGDLLQSWQTVYADEQFVHQMPGGEWPQTKYAYGSNHVFMQLKLDKRTGRVILVAALDNLVKGASGQAVQNMNILFGLPEETGLKTNGMWP
ncbi:N-acetyl-gamma-glutamyl-phosphate reductase [Syntrophobotulus glycolicus DSM 8271]|uniref:N-acetyl-gamma-glutamyl-phosphate reductase n=1 Tax=Syntrophobotulus glycolicus (strain DSM 8271 / FlGlyR) TaxID=645991 RepID=F0SY45_SYNGF|nr:N-acetyl-gamma-glutamyl-phosphate reductase [Syntrophobotulus glycolicus]ADY54795.1 N-acetyl-gamma-glutamyl-phosphate reductase [Syntrophobotulus glycolicus DSM 8271]